MDDAVKASRCAGSSIDDSQHLYISKMALKPRVEFAMIAVSCAG